MPTNRVSSRSISDSIRNVVDYLLDAGLALSVTALDVTPTRVAWHPSDRSTPFLIGHSHPTVSDYRSWVSTGNYTCLLHDASILQVSYFLDAASAVERHRLAYIPCPWDLDISLMDDGYPLNEILDLYHDSDVVAMRSPVRFDFDVRAARLDHPASHLTFNSVDCRIACVAPLHVHRFTSFVFQHFYAKQWNAHRPFFSDAHYRHIRGPRILPGEHDGIHLSWNTRLRRPA